MSDETKVMLSGGELAMATDTGIILTKQAVMQKASALFTGLIPAIQAVFSPALTVDEKLSASVPKISKGENYRGFPFVIMDYPAAFERDHIFALRTMFWWGHFISITLHLSGRYKNAFAENIFVHGRKMPFFIVAGEEEWEHHFEEDNFKLFSSLTLEEIEAVSQKHYLKIALRYELQDWNRMQELLPVGYREVAKLLS